MMTTMTEDDQPEVGRYGRIVKKPKPKVPWRTRDMVCAVYLAYKGHDVIRIDIEGPERYRSAYFVFNESDDLSADVAAFMGGSALVEPNQFNMTFAKMKDEMFNVLNSSR